MAIRRQKLDRDVNLTLDRGHVVDMAPEWTFTVTYPYHGEITFDFNPYRRHDRDELAGQFRDAIWNLRYEMVGSSLRLREEYLRYFLRFLDELLELDEPITQLSQIDRILLDRYLTW